MQDRARITHTVVPFAWVLVNNVAIFPGSNGLAATLPAAILRCANQTGVN